MEEMVTTQTRQLLGASANVKAQIDNTATVAQTNESGGHCSSISQGSQGWRRASYDEGGPYRRGCGSRDNTHELRDRFDTLTELKQQTNGMDR